RRCVVTKIHPRVSSSRVKAPTSPSCAKDEMKALAGALNGAQWRPLALRGAQWGDEFLNLNKQTQTRAQPSAGAGAGAVLPDLPANANLRPHLSGAEFSMSLLPLCVSSIEKPFIPGWSGGGVGLRPFTAELWLIGTIVAVLLTPFFTRKSNLACAAVGLVGLVM